MNRTILSVVFAVALFGGVALIFVWYVSFGMGRPSGGEVRVSELAQPATLSYYKDGSLSISASSELDAYRALGYQAGRDHGWSVALLRQTAEGRLGEWFGAPVLQIDEFSRRLGFASSARQAAANLAPEDAIALAAYSDGVTSALRDEGVSLGNEFVLFDIHPEAWEPWHSLAIGRLIAWLSEPPIRAVADDSAFWSIRSLEDADRRFRGWLHLHGADMSAAWSWQDSVGTHFAARFVYGATALPMFSAASLTWPETSVAGIVLIGTPFFPVLSGPAGTSITMFSSQRQLQTIEISRDTGLLGDRHERILDRSGNESLVSVATYGDRILVDVDGRAPVTDSVFQSLVLSWPGLGTDTDWPVWRQAVLQIGATGSTSPERLGSLHLFDGDGLTLTTSDVSIAGSPLVQTSYRNRYFVSNNSAGAYAAQRLAEDGTDVEFLANEDLSVWARENVPRALTLLGPDSVISDRQNEAISYLRNWDYRYNTASIGASIFDRWMLEYRQERGTYPEILIPQDSLTLASMRLALRESLRKAVDSLSSQAGADLARWRLEYLRTGKRYFPVWSYLPLQEELPKLMRSRYAPLGIPQAGHPTTLLWQSGLEDEPANSPAHVLVRGIVGQPQSLSVRPDYEIGSGFIARYIAGPPRVEIPDAHDVVSTLVLLPQNR